MSGIQAFSPNFENSLSEECLDEIANHYTHTYSHVQKMVAKNYLKHKNIPETQTVSKLLKPLDCSCCINSLQLQLIQHHSIQWSHFKNLGDPLN